MDAENILQNLVRVGTVSSVNNNKRIARVIFEDKNMVSGWLTVLQHPGAGVYVKPNGEHSHEISGGSMTEMDGQHDHESNVTYWMPKINDKVLVLYIPVFNGDGYILGVI